MTARTAALAATFVVLAMVTTPVVRADNTRLNDSVVADVYAIRYDAGCRDPIRIDPKLRLAAQWHSDDLLSDRRLGGHTGSDGSTPQDRAHAAGYLGAVAETVAINPALAISGIEIIRQWYYDPAAMAIISDCGNTSIGVWSGNSLDRSVVVAVYGRPS